MFSFGGKWRLRTGLPPWVSVHRVLDRAIFRALRWVFLPSATQLFHLDAGAGLRRQLCSLSAGLSITTQTLCSTAKTVSSSWTDRFRTSFAHGPPSCYPRKPFRSSDFLRQVIPSHCLQYIRSLEIVFAPFTHLTRPDDDHPALKDWPETIEWAKNRLNLPALTLCLVVAGNHGFEPAESKNMSRAQGEQILETYKHIYSPFQRLGGSSSDGLARFHAAFAWSWKWTGLAWLRFKEEAWEWLEDAEPELKVEAESFVMGDRYEHGCLRAGQPTRSVWKWSCLK